MWILAGVTQYFASLFCELCFERWPPPMSTLVSLGVSKEECYNTNNCAKNIVLHGLCYRRCMCLCQHALLFKSCHSKHKQADGLLSNMHTASCSRLVPYITSQTPVEHIVSSRARIILEQDQPDASSHRNQKGCRLPCQRLSETFTGLLRRVAMNLSARPAAMARNEMWLHNALARPKKIEKVLSLGFFMRMGSRLTD